MIIDFHTHCFPAALAPRALMSLAHEGGGLRPYFDGTAEGLLASMDKNGVQRSVVLSIATKPSQAASVNRFAASINGGRLAAFGSVVPYAPDAIDELRRIKDASLPGVKLHPYYQGFSIDDPKLFPFYETAGELGLITLFHMGKDIGFHTPDVCTPAMLKRILPRFGGTPVVAAHLGGYMCWDETLDCLCGEDVYLDTSYLYSRVIKQLFEKIVRKHGAEKILFGSDMPWSDTADELRLIDSLNITAAEKERILGLNAERLLKV
ncbi:MAG: amidohydrolase family protein [Firmicutes bacterium]|nr:amidohydrolase family protein [Bacillota bacterium]